MKLLRGLTFTFNSRLEPRTQAEWNELMESPEAWMAISHGEKMLLRCPMKNFDIEPNYMKLDELIPVSEVRVNGPVWAEWALDLIDG